MKLGLIARADKTGLGNQTKNLARMLQPSKILVINSQPFNSNKQYPQTYDDYNAFTCKGFPTDPQIKAFLNGIDILMTCETFYNSFFMIRAKQLKIKTINQYNYEFLDNLNQPGYPVPSLLLAPSLWHYSEVAAKFPNVQHLPPPTDEKQFDEVRLVNMKRKGQLRFLHVVGRGAMMDRNGTRDLIKALKLTKKDFELVIKSQTNIEFDGDLDSRVTVDYRPLDNEEDLYRDFDAMIMPRRYGGLCLPMNEALLSGLPVIMMGISPNNAILPLRWLTMAQSVDSFFARTTIEVYSAVPISLARMIDWLCEVDLSVEKKAAYELGMEYFSMEVLKQQYEKVFKDLLET